MYALCIAAPQIEPAHCSFTSSSDHDWQRCNASAHTRLRTNPSTPPQPCSKSTTAAEAAAPQQHSPPYSNQTPCAENDKIDVLAIGASQFRGNYLPLLQKLLPAHKVVLYSPSPFNKNTHPHPLIFLRGSMHQKSESVRREVI